VPARLRAVVSDVEMEYQMSEPHACRLVELGRSTDHYRARRRPRGMRFCERGWEQSELSQWGQAHRRRSPQIRHAENTFHARNLCRPNCVENSATKFDAARSETRLLAIGNLASTDAYRHEGGTEPRDCREASDIGQPLNK